MLRVMLIDEDEERRALLNGALLENGYEIVSEDSGTQNLHDLVKKACPDVIIVGTDSPSRDSLEDICLLSRDAPRPIVMFTHDGDREKIREAIRSGVSAYVVDGLKGDRIRSLVDVAIARFEAHQALMNELDAMQGKLADRKVVERAKGILMQKKNCSEEEAYRILRKAAMDKNMKLVEVAAQLIDMANLFT